MILKFVCFLVGTFVGMLITSLAVIAEDADRCDECMRARKRQL